MFSHLFMDTDDKTQSPLPPHASPSAMGDPWPEHAQRAAVVWPADFCPHALEELSEDQRVLLTKMYTMAHTLTPAEARVWVPRFDLLLDPGCLEF